MSVINKNTSESADHFKEFLQAITKREDFLTYNFDTHKVATNGVNNLGVITKIDIKGETNHGEKQVNLFVKSKLLDPNNIKLLSINDVYSRELYAYKELSDIYNQLQQEANVPLEKRYKFVKCYEESNTDMIIMEDVTKLGYVNCDRFEIISLEFAQKCIQELAKFHALSLVLEKEKLDYFNCNIKLLKYPFIFNEDYVSFLNNMYEICLITLEGEYKNKLRSVRELCEKYYNLVNNTSFIRCLCHGDYRTMNIMAKYTNDHLSDVIPLDYQFIFYGSPVIDFIYFIFGSTDRKFRGQHLEDLKYLYHDTMEDFLKHFNMDINLYYPRKEFDKAYEENLEFGLLVSVWFLPVSLAENNELLDFRKTSVGDGKFTANEKVKARLEDIIDDFTEWGLIKSDDDTLIEGKYEIK